MSSVARLMSVAVLATMIVVAAPIAAQATDPIARVNGGGTADFVPHPLAFNTTGFTNFSVGATVNADGTGGGHFVCVIPGIVAISLDVMGGWVNGDGSVTIWGLGHGWDSFIPGPFSDLPVIVTLRDGGPGVGGFDYWDASGFFGDEPFELFDRELVRVGGIRIRP